MSVTEHTRFEELCAAASVGQVSRSEYEELSAHLHECSLCREFYSDIENLAHAQLPVAGAKSLEREHSSLWRRSQEKAQKARFVAKAREHGLAITLETPSRAARVPVSGFSFLRLRFSYHYVYAAVILVLLGGAGFSLHRWRQAVDRGSAGVLELAKLSRENAALAGQISTLSERKESTESVLVQTRNNTAEQTQTMAVRIRELERLVQEKDSVTEDVKGQLANAAGHSADVEKKLVDSQQVLALATQEVAQLRAVRGATEAQQAQIAELDRRVKEQTGVITDQQRLLAVDQDVRNLMTARELHITDVFDMDGGKRKSAFGRVFYTEGKSLVFYAFDLDRPRAVDAKHSFQAWGQLSDSPTSAVSLGIFYVDDPNQKRWMLKFDNPEMLKQINAVFVTTEPHGGTDRPTGQKLMYAYLGHEPNHP